MTESDPATVLLGVAAYGLDSARTLPGVALDDRAFFMLVHRAEHHRLVGLLGTAVAAGAFPVTAEQRETLEEMFQGWLGHALRIEGLLGAAADALAAAGIEHRVLKGAALAHTVYPVPEQRVFGDVDLLVGSDDFVRSVEVLCTAIGARRDVPELRPGFDTRFGKEVLLRVGNLELDVHRTFVEGALGMTVELSDLFVPSERFEMGERSLSTLPPAQQLLHAAYAAVLGDWPPRLIGLRDALQIITERDPEPAVVLRLAERWRARAVLAHALVAADEALAPRVRPSLVDWAWRYRPGPVERGLLRAHLGPARAFTGQAAALVVVPGVRHRLAYARAILWPQRSYLRSRGFTWAGFARRALPGRLKGQGRPPEGRP